MSRKPDVIENDLRFIVFEYLHCRLAITAVFQNEGDSGVCGHS